MVIGAPERSLASFNILSLPVVPSISYSDSSNTIDPTLTVTDSFLTLNAPKDISEEMLDL